MFSFNFCVFINKLNFKVILIVLNIYRGKKRKHKSKKQEKPTEKIDKDSIEHANWWKVAKIEDITGPVAIEFGKHTYVKALDNGLFTIGAPHADYEGPYPEEILTAVVINERKIAFKSGYGKYLRVEKDGNVTGRSDAIGAMEQWEPVFQEGKMALQSATDCFLSVDDEDDSIVAKNKSAGPQNMVAIRCQTVKQDTTSKEVPVEENGSLEQVEINYVYVYRL